MYAIQACADPARIEVALTGILEAPEVVRCISQASALAEAGSVRRICVDLTSSIPGEVDQALVVAALRSNAVDEIKLAVIASGRVARMSQLVLTHAGLRPRAARLFSNRRDAEQWLGYRAPSGELAATDRRHVDHAAALLAGAKSEPVAKITRTSVA